MTNGITYMIGAQAMLAIMAACVRALKNLPLMEIIFLRSVTGMALVLAYMLFFKISFRSQRQPELIIRGVIGLFALACYYFSITHLTLSTATLLANTSPVLVVILAGIFLKEPITFKLLFFIGLSLVGVIFLLRPEFSTHVTGYMIGLLSAFFIAIAFLYLRKLKEENTFLVVFYFVTISSLGSAPFALMEWNPPSLEQWYLVLAIALTTFFGQIWLTRAFQYGQASVISAVGYIGPVFCWGLGLVLFNEAMETSAIIGAGIIVSSGIAITFFHRQNNPPKR